MGQSSVKKHVSHAKKARPRRGAPRLWSSDIRASRAYLMCILSIGSLCMKGKVSRMSSFARLLSANKASTCTENRRYIYILFSLLFCAFPFLKSIF